MYLQKVISKNINFFVDIMKITDDKRQDPDPELDPHPYQNVTDPEHWEEDYKYKKKKAGHTM